MNTIDWVTLTRGMCFSQLSRPEGHGQGAHWFTSPGRTPFLACIVDSHHLMVSPQSRERESKLSDFSRSLTASCRPHPHDLITPHYSQRPHLHMPSPCGLRLQHMKLGIQSITVTASLNFWVNSRSLCILRMWYGINFGWLLDCHHSLYFLYLRVLSSRTLPGIYIIFGVQ